MPDDYFEIFFEYLTVDAQQSLLDFVGVEDPKEMNWDVIPIAVYPKPEPEE